METTNEQNEIATNEEVNKYFYEPGSKCRGLLQTTTCHNPIQNKGVNSSGFCETCWYPSIEEDYKAYQELRKEGYTRDEAAMTVGILSTSISLNTHLKPDPAKLVTAIPASAFSNKETTDYEQSSLAAYVE